VTRPPCTATTRQVDPEEALTYDATYTFSDKKKIVNDLVQSLTTNPPLADTTDRPVVIVYGIANRTSEHIDTSGITDEIRKEIILSGKARFVNKTSGKTSPGRPITSSMARWRRKPSLPWATGRC
jgi:PBP1b-binding outer membrane lipoprotein LpoB